MCRSRLEDTITFHLIERVQFPLNSTIYRAGGVKIPECDLSLFDWMLRETEIVHSRVRRYQSPDEHPFFPEALQTPILQPLQYPQILYPNNVNVNEDIKRRYIDDVLPNACRHFDRKDRGETQENYGSAATCDVSCLQALSRRIHFGKFVAESKFQSQTDLFIKLIKNEDRAGIDKAITNEAVEKQVLERLRLKARIYGRDPSVMDDDAGKINVDAVVAMYQVSSTLRERIMVRLKGTGNRDTTNKGGGSGIFDAAAEGHKVGFIETIKAPFHAFRQGKGVPGACSSASMAFTAASKSDALHRIT